MRQEVECELTCPLTSVLMILSLSMTCWTMALRSVSYEVSAVVARPFSVNANFQAMLIALEEANIG